jgi:hypothetical protein
MPQADRQEDADSSRWFRLGVDGGRDVHRLRIVIGLILAAPPAIIVSVPTIAIMNVIPTMIVMHSTIVAVPVVMPVIVLGHGRTHEHGAGERCHGKRQQLLRCAPAIGCLLYEGFHV